MYLRIEESLRTPPEVNVVGWHVSRILVGALRMVVTCACDDVMKPVELGEIAKRQRDVRIEISVSRAAAGLGMAALCNGGPLSTVDAFRGTSQTERPT